MIPRPMRGRRRRRLRFRHPIPFWIAAVALTALTTATVGRVTDAAATERDRWGERVPVVVAATDHGPGDALHATVELRPAALVPDGALAEVPDDTTVTAFVAAGEVVLDARVAPGGLSPIAARLPPGTRGVAVPPGMAPLPLTVGDRVDVLGATTLTRDAVVVDVAEAAVTIAVDADDAAGVAYEAAAGTVTLVLTATSSRR
jgi:Flp pilus assembly protein CpaB